MKKPQNCSVIDRWSGVCKKTVIPGRHGFNPYGNQKQKINKIRRWYNCRFRVTRYQRKGRSQNGVNLKKINLFSTFRIFETTSKICEKNWFFQISRPESILFCQKFTVVEQFQYSEVNFFQNFLCLGSIQKEYKNNKMWFWFLKYWNKKKIIFWTHFDQIQMQFLLHNPLTFRIPCNFLMKLPHLIPRQNLHIIAGHKYLIKCFNVPHLSQIKHIEKLHLLPSVIKKWKAW